MSTELFDVETFGKESGETRRPQGLLFYLVSLPLSLSSLFGGGFCDLNSFLSFL